MKRKKILIAFLFVLVIISGTLIFLLGDSQLGEVYTVKKGRLTSGIDCMGEIKGMKATTITVPAGLRDWTLRVYEYKITGIAKEGESVKKGDFILKLDEEKLQNNMRNKFKEKEKVDADLKNAVLDSTVRLTSMREDILNLKHDLEYERIDLEASAYQSVAEQRRIEMKYKKAEIALNKKKRDYILEQNKLKVRISRSKDRAKRLMDEIGKLQKAIQTTRVVSPSDGLLMFEKDYSGKKFTKDATVHTFMRIPLATLPDMSTVLSEALVKEIDVTKMNIGDSVRVSIDALNSKEFPGTVIKIANMGEENKNFDMKVFKVKIQLDYSDPELKPGMTSSNKVILGNVVDGLIVPMEAVFADGNRKYVLRKESGSYVRKYVKLGIKDDEQVEIIEGLQEGDKILLDQPEAIKTAEL